MRRWVPLVLATTACAACAAPAGPAVAPTATPVDGVEELSEGLTDLGAQCTFAAHTVALVLQPGDVAWLTVDGTALDVNGIPCGAATVATTTQIRITEGAPGDETVILDERGGVFGTSASAATGPGVVIALGTGTDAVKYIGTSGADRVVIGAAGLSINSDPRLDIALAGPAALTVNLDDGDDQLSGAGDVVTGAAYPAALTLYGGAGNDTVRGGAGADTIYGGDGDDTFVGGPVPDGADLLVGGPGRDIADYAARTASLAISLDGLANDGGAGELDNVGSDVEVVRGGTANDTLTGGGAVDELDGGPGDDLLVTGSGADTFDGGPGLDTVSYAARSASQSIFIDGNADSGGPGEHDRILLTVENVIGGAGDDSIIGSALANTLDGGPGDDTIDGGAGDDRLIGGLGADHLAGGPGTDTVDYSARTAAVLVVLDGVTASGEAGEGDRLAQDIENAVGGAGDDTLVGNASDNQLEGGPGADSLSGLAGDDILDGGPGADALDCGAGEGDIALDPTTSSVASCEL